MFSKQYEGRLTAWYLCYWYTKLFGY